MGNNVVEPIICVNWEIDEALLSKKVIEVLETSKQTFPEVNWWNASRENDMDIQDYSFNMPLSELKEGKTKSLDLIKLWNQSVEHFNHNGLDGNFPFVTSYLYSRNNDFGCEMTFSKEDFDFRVTEDIEGEAEEYVEKYQTVLIQLLKNIGKCPSIGGTWFFRERAFVGEPHCLYVNVRNQLREDGLERQRAIRRLTKQFIDVGYARKVLVEEIGVDKFEDLGNGRIYVEFGGTWLTDFDAIEDYFDMEMGEREKIPTENNPRLDKWREIVEKELLNQEK